MSYCKKPIQLAVILVTMLFGTVHAHQPQTEAVLKHHLESFGAGDISAIMEDYTEESMIVLPNGVLKGKAQIIGLFEALVAEFGQDGVTFELTHSTTVDHIAYITWKAQTPNNNYKFATDTFVIRGSKILYQTIAFDVEPKS